MHSFLILSVALFAGPPVVDDARKPVPCWERDVQPLLTVKCLSCHSAGTVDLRTYARDSFYMHGMVRMTRGKYMPPPPAASLTESEIKLLES